MAVSQKGWELPNSQVWLADIDIESDEHFLIWQLHFAVKKFQTVNKNVKILSIFFEQYLFMAVPKSLMRKKYRGW